MQFRLMATAGHVDHGKTTLLEALTGQNADRLQEEKERGLTVDLGFADMEDGEIHVGFVDLPGHQDFIKNMVSGVTSVQGVLFVVSAVDGWQAQSREHFEIVNLLEPAYCCFALTKIDRADEDLRLVVEAEIEQALEGTPYADAPRMAVSARTGEGVEALRDRLYRDLASTSDPPDFGKPYCPVDRVFSVRGQGTVVTGSLGDGTVREGSELMRMPAGEPGRVRSVQQYHRSVDEAVPGSRVALNVPEWDRDTTRRGDVATVASAGRSGDVLDGRLRAPRSMAHPLRHDTQVLAHLGTGRESARVLLADAGELEPGGRTLARLRLLSGGVFARPGDPVILRSFNDRQLLGRLRVGAVDSGGRWRDAGYRAWLGSRFPVNPSTLVISSLRREGVLSVESVAEGTRYDPKSVRAAAGEIEGVLRLEGGWLADPDWWNARLDEVIERVRAYHRDYPLRPGLPKTRLGDVVEADVPRERFLEALEERGVNATGEYLRRAGFEPEPDAEDRRRADDLVDRLNEAGLETPNRARVEEELGRELLEHLIRRGRIVELNEERLIGRRALDRLRERVRGFLDEEEPVRLSDVRDHLGSSRKFVIPLMEYFDRRGMTYREGDLRYLRRNDGGDGGDSPPTE